MVFMVPGFLSRHFTGRVRELKKIHEILTGPSANPKSVSVFGMPGVGKSQITLKFAHDNKDIYENIFYVRATDQTQLFRDFETIYSLLQPQEFPVPQLESIIQIVLQWLATNRDWLLIFDNVVDLHIIKQFLPTSHSGAILFSMRSGLAAEELGLAGEIEILCMEEAEGVELILKILRPSGLSGPENLEPQYLAKKIQKELGGLPLALVQGAASSKHRKWTMNEYLKKLQTQKLETVKLESETVGQTASHSVFTLAAEGITPITLMLLKIISYLDHQDVPFQLLENGRCELLAFFGFLSKPPLKYRVNLGGYRPLVGTTPPPYIGSKAVIRGCSCDNTISLLQQLFSDPTELENTILCLSDFALIRRDDAGSIWMHDLFCEFTQELVRPTEKKLIATSALVLARGAFPDPKSHENWVKCEAITPHIIRSLKITALYKVKIFLQYNTANLLEGFYFRTRRFSEALEWYQSALPGYEKVLGTDHSLTCQIIETIATLFMYQNENNKALRWLQIGLSSTLKKHHIQNIKAFYRLFKYYSTNIEGPWPWSFISTYTDIISMTYVLLIPPPLPLTRTIYMTKLLKENHHILNTVCKVACSFQAQEEHDKALEWFQRALAGYEKILGMENANFYSIALAFEDRRDYDTFLGFSQRALAGYGSTLGEENSATLKAASIIAGIYARAGDSQEATVIRQRFNIPLLPPSALPIN